MITLSTICGWDFGQDIRVESFKETHLPTLEPHGKNYSSNRCFFKATHLQTLEPRGESKRKKRRAKRLLVQFLVVTHFRILEPHGTKSNVLDL